MPKKHKVTKNSKLAGLKRYYRVVSYLEDHYEVTRREAREIYSRLSEHSGKKATKKYMLDHPRITGRIISEVTEEPKKASIEEFIEALSDIPGKDAISSLFDRHYKEENYQFEIENEILKISISTTKTRKKFSVRIA